VLLCSRRNDAFNRKRALGHLPPIAAERVIADNRMSGADHRKRLGAETAHGSGQKRSLTAPIRRQKPGRRRGCLHSPCPDIGGALRVTGERSREPRQGCAKRRPKARPD
jgi:hypothetical protein